MTNTIVLEGYVSKIENFRYNGDKVGIRFDIGHQVYHKNAEKPEEKYSSEFFHCVAMGGMVNRILAKKEDGSQYVEVGSRTTVTGRLTVRKNTVTVNGKAVTYENVAVIIKDISVSAKPKAKANKEATPAEAASSDIPF